MGDWDLHAEINTIIGSKEWLAAELKVNKKSFTFSSVDIADIRKPTREPFPVNIEVLESGAVVIECIANDGRHLSVALSPILLAQLIEAFGHFAARSGHNFPFVETARALMAASTSIVNRPRP